MKKSELAQTKIRRIRPPAFEHINRQIPPEPHTSMYVWHKYWSRKTWNVVGEHIKAYTCEHEVVFDPFAGSGVVAVEAVRIKRRAIVCDLMASSDHQALLQFDAEEEVNREKVAAVAELP